MCFRNNNNWLFFRTKRELKRTYSDVYTPYYLLRYKAFIGYLLGQKSWTLILCFVGLVFSISSANLIESLNFLHIDSKTLNIIIDQRTANLAAIISITLVVVGFLITNMAVKEPFAYRLLFKHSFLYPIFYFALTLIGGFVLISTIRDAIPPEKFQRLTIAGTYLPLVVLFLIGLLFTRIIKFTNPKEIKMLLQLELMDEARKKVVKDLINRISQNVFSNLMVTYNVTKFNLANYNFANIVGVQAPVQVPARNIRVISNIYLKSIEDVISTMPQRDVKNYNTVGIGSNFDINQDVVWTANRNLIGSEKAALMQAIITKKIKSKKENSNSDLYKEEFERKFKKAISDNDYDEIKYTLDSFYKLYEMKLNNL